MRLDRNALFYVLVVSLSVASTSGFSTTPSAFRSCSVDARITPTVNGINAMNAPSSTALFMSEKSVYEINRAMDDLAEKCGDINKPVVVIASQVEDMYIAAERKDIVSFNSLLKAWGKTTHALERRKYSQTTTSESMSKMGSVPTVAVYTPRDAAEHLTKHLITAEEEYESDPDNAQVVPDEMSYNIAIGEYQTFYYSTVQYSTVHLHSCFVLFCRRGTPLLPSFSDF